MADGSKAILGSEAAEAAAADGTTARCEEEEEEPLPALPESETSSPKSSLRRKSSEKGNISSVCLSLSHSVCEHDGGGGGDGGDGSGDDDSSNLRIFSLPFLLRRKFVTKIHVYSSSIE